MPLRPRTPAQMNRLLRHLVAAYKRCKAKDSPSDRALWCKRHGRLASGYKTLNGKQSKHYSIT